MLRPCRHGVRSRPAVSTPSSHERKAVQSQQISNVFPISSPQQHLIVMKPNRVVASLLRYNQFHITDVAGMASQALKDKLEADDDDELEQFR